MSPDYVEPTVVPLQMASPSHSAGLKIESHHLTCPKNRIHPSPVGHRARAGEIVPVMHRLQWTVRDSLMLPQQLTSRTVIRGNKK